MTYVGPGTEFVCPSANSVRVLNSLGTTLLGLPKAVRPARLVQRAAVNDVLVLPGKRRKEREGLESVLEVLHRSPNKTENETGSGAAQTRLLFTVTIP